jgi:hypothetical protein
VNLPFSPAEVHKASLKKKKILFVLLLLTSEAVGLKLNCLI